MTDLKRCPCGKVPESFDLMTEGSAWVIGTPRCCREWGFVFNSNYKTGDELQALANEAWNGMPRSNNEN